MAAICRFFDEDAVYRINKKKFVDVGLVLENSEFLSSDEEEIEDAHCPEWQRMKKGHVRIAWHPNGMEEVLSEKKVRLFDRSLMPGDVVRKLIKGRDAQLGYCRNTSVKAAVQVVGTKQVIIGVDSKDLTQMEEFQADVAVFRNSWVGMVKAVKSDLTLVFADGSRCIMSDLDALDMDDILDKRERSSEFKKFSFYPGQQLYGPPYCFENVKWLTLNNITEEALKNLSRSIRVNVENVKVVSLGVQWVCRAYREEAKCECDVEQPKYLIQGDDLKSIKMMNIFEPCTLQIGDRNYLVIKDSYRIISLNDWRSEMAALLKSSDSFSEIPLMKPKPPPEQLPGAEDEELAAVCNGVEGSDSEFEDIDDENDDGIYSDSTSVTSRSTSSVDKSKGPRHKTKKGPSLATKMLKKKKIRRARRRVAKEILPLKAGDRVVTETLITETKAHVVWQDGSVENDIPSTHLYPVHHLDGHEFFPGDFVVDSKESRPYEYGVVKQVDHNGRTALVTWMKTYHAGADPHPEILSEEEVSVYDIKDHPDFRYRPGSCVIRVANFEDSDSESTAGQVVDVHPTGQVEVSWVSGKQSLCYPQELYRVGEYDSDDLWGDDESFCDEEESWETESEASEIGTDDNIDKEFGDASRSLCEHGALKAIEREDEKSADDSKSMQEKLLANIEKLRAGMARLEEVFTQNPTLQTCNVMRRLLELYKHCKVLDQLLGTTYFHEKHLQSLIERLRHRGRVNSIQHMADQISRLFSIGISSQTEPMESCTRDQNGDFCCFEQATKDSCIAENESHSNNDSSEVVNKSTGNSERPQFNLLIEAPTCNDASTDTSDNPAFNQDSKIECSFKTSGVLLSPMGMPLMSNGNEPRNICQQLCAILKSRLLKAHEDVEQRFGMSHSDTTALLAAEMDVLPMDQNGLEPSSEATEPPTVDCEKTSAVANESIVATSTEVVDEDPADKEEECSAGQGVYSVLESVPDSHKYKLSILQPTDMRAFFKRVRKEMQILRTSLPEGIIVKGFDDRIDLYSVMIKGPKRTPYEDGLFFFDFQLPAEYPKVPPHCHYISYCSDRLNPNLYEGGKVCVSLLGTWGGKGTEVWSPETSNLLQVIVSIQGLILVSEPYYNEAGYERQRGTQLGKENSRIYNEMVILKLVQAMTKLVLCPPEVFEAEIVEHFSSHASKFIQRLERWLSISESWNTIHPTTPASPTDFREFHGKTCDSSSQDSGDNIPLPEFPLIPASKGFCLTLRKSLESFKDSVASASTKLS